jgi:hypothetical protein
MKSQNFLSREFAIEIGSKKIKSWKGVTLCY